MKIRLFHISALRGALVLSSNQLFEVYTEVECVDQCAQTVKVEH